MKATPKNPHAVAMGRKGGRAKVRKGFAMASPERRREIAMMGVDARKKAAGAPTLGALKP